MPGAKYRSIKKPRTYEALREKGMPKAKAAAISNAQAQGESPAATAIKAAMKRKGRPR